MHQTLKSPRCRQPNNYKNVTVVPIDFGTASSRQPLQVRSPRSSSKTKLRLVSPMRKLNQTALLGSSNSPNHAIQPQKAVFSPKYSVPIQLGGRNSSKNKENTVDPSATFSKISNHSYLQSSKHSLSKVQGAALIATQCFPISYVPIQSRKSSPNNSIHITYKPVPVFVNKQMSSSPENIQPITMMPVKRGSIGGNVSDTKNNYPTELQIREENVIEQLKESYECEINQIKKLKQEIEKNNHEIKKLLKSSRASKETTKSKTMIQDPTTQRSPKLNDRNDQIEIKILNNENANSRSFVYHCEEPNHQFDQEYKDYERKQNEICSKKTLINDLDFQTNQKPENVGGYKTEIHYTEGVQTQEVFNTPVLKQQSSSDSKDSSKKPRLTLNNVCQLQFIHLNKNNAIQQPIDLQDSIICQKEEVLQLPSKKSLKQMYQIVVKAEDQQKIGSFKELKKESQKVISQIRSLTKAVYESEVKETKVPAIEQITKAEVKAQLEALETNILPVSQKIITVEPIRIENQLKKSGSKVMENKKDSKDAKEKVVQSLKQEPQSLLKKSISPNQGVEIKTQVDNSTTKTVIPDPKKQGRRINNSIYL